MPPSRQPTPPSPDIVVERRVNAIFAAVVGGLQRWEIQQAVAAQQIKERRQRDAARIAAREQGLDDPDAEALLDVPIVWGDKPIPDRTLDDYIASARQMLTEQSSEFTHERTMVLAQQKARLDFIYARAMNESKLYAALKAIELTDAIFGLRDHARTLQLQASIDDDSDDGVDGRALPASAEERAQMFRALLRSVIHEGDPMRAISGPVQTIMP